MGRRSECGTAVGTNQFHGTVYEFLRNTDLNAIGYVFGARPPRLCSRRFTGTSCGVTIGGPIIKDKLFFFGDYEGSSGAGYLNFYNVPDTNDRMGILPVTVVDRSRRSLSKNTADSGRSVESVRRRCAGRFAGNRQRDPREQLGGTVPVTDKSDKYDAESWTIRSKPT